MNAIGSGLICIKPVENDHFVVVISKKTARFKVIDLSLLSQTKLDAYASTYRLAKVVQDGENARQVSISQQSPFIELLLRAVEDFTVDGLKVSKVTTMSDDEYQSFVAETLSLANPDAKKTDETSQKELTEKSGLEASFRVGQTSSDASKKSVSFIFSYLATKVNECFCKCSQKILEKFVETERRIAELDKEASDKKIQKKKELKKELEEQDIVRTELKASEFKKANV